MQWANDVILKSYVLVTLGETNLYQLYFPFYNQYNLWKNLRGKYDEREKKRWEKGKKGKMREKGRKNQ